MKKLLFALFLIIGIALLSVACSDEPYVVEYYTVTFDSNGGTEITPEEVLKDKTVTKPANPTRRGYEFISWQLDGKDFNFNTKITSDITLKAKWELTHEHNWSTEYSHNDSQHWYDCSGCDDKKDAKEHTVTEWIANLENNTCSGICTICSDEAKKDITSGVVITGIGEFDNILFPTALDAYNTIKKYLAKDENGGLGEGPLSEDKFNKVFSHNGDITWSIYGEQEMHEIKEKTPYYLSFGRAAMHYSSTLHIENITVEGRTNNAKLYCSNLQYPYEWWGDSEQTPNITFKNIKLEGTKNSDSIMPSQSYTYGATITYENCDIKGRIYAYINSQYTLNVRNCTFDSINESNYAIHIQGSLTETATVNIENNTFKNSRGINIDQATCEATVVGNTLDNCGNLSEKIDNNYYGVIQITQGNDISIDKNTIQNCNGNAIWLWSNEKGGNFFGKLSITNNTISNCTYAFCNYNQKDYELTHSGNIVTNTNTDKCFIRRYDSSGNKFFEEAEATIKLK